MNEQKDTIIDEVRKNRAKIEQECHHDMNELIKRVRKLEEKSFERIFVSADIVSLDRTTE